uniref:Uncharacterized protein n=1 Tax=Anguilla anguilla TaxID=7936 RepID=A0A0E9PE03_ANGAN
MLKFNLPLSFRLLKAQICQRKYVWHFTSFPL